MATPSTDPAGVCVSRKRVSGSPSSVSTRATNPPRGDPSNVAGESTTSSTQASADGSST